MFTLDSVLVWIMHWPINCHACWSHARMHMHDWNPGLIKATHNTLILIIYPNTKICDDLYLLLNSACIHPSPALQHLSHMYLPI